MRNLLVLTIFAVSLGFFFTPASQAGIALPPLWQDNFGDELEDVSDCDDCEEMITLPIPFPFNGNTYNTAYVGSNGCIQFDGLGLDDEIDYDHWNYMEEFLADSDPDNPEICPFNTDLDTEEGGTVYYNNSSNPLIITWDGVAAHNDTDIINTFQILLYLDGSIVLSFNGIGVGEDLLDLDGGIVVGVTPSDFPFDGELFVPGDPGPNDLNSGTAAYNRATIYERWCYDEANSCGVEGSDTGLPGPINTAFDLDFQSVCFAPIGAGFQVSSAGEENPAFVCAAMLVRPIPTLSEWGLIAMAGVLGIVGLLVLRRRNVTA